MKTYIKKPIPVIAVQWTGENVKEINDFVDGFAEWINDDLYITTIEGDMFAEVGSYIIKGVDGEFYPCRESIFNMTYEEVKDEQRTAD